LDLALEDLLVVLGEQLFVGEVDAELLEGVFVEVLEAKDVEEVDFAVVCEGLLDGGEEFVAVLLVAGTEGDFDAIDDCLEDSIVDGSAEGIAVQLALCLLGVVEERSSLGLQDHRLELRSGDLQGLQEEGQSFPIENLAGVVVFVSLVGCIIEVEVAQLQDGAKESPDWLLIDAKLGE
jgi:hypothetical protein